MHVLTLLSADFLLNDVFQSILKDQIGCHDEKSWNEHFPSNRISQAFERRRSKTKNFTETRFRRWILSWNFLFWTTFISGILLLSRKKVKILKFFFRGSTKNHVFCSCAYILAGTCLCFGPWLETFMLDKNISKNPNLRPSRVTSTWLGRFYTFLKFRLTSTYG